MSGLQIPGRVELSIELAEAPLASPACLTLQTASGPHVKIIGGLTKVEHVAALVVKDCAPGDEQAVAARAVDLAEAILAECARRRQSPAVNGAKQE